MYTLTLTAEERQAFDWVGDRYNAGAVAELFRELTSEGQPEWEDDGDIAFMIPEHVAWQVRDLAEDEGNLWPCFTPELAAKLNDLCSGIV
jgi:hypothetical protein